MLHLFSASLSRRFLACATLMCGVAFSGAALAQMPPQPIPQGAPPPGAAVNPVCPRLEAQLATIDRGGSNDPAKDDQIRRYQDAAAKQQGELDRMTAQARRMGCDSTGFFSLFSGQNAQCGPVNNQIQQMRTNLDQMQTSLERLRGGGLGADRDNQRRSVLVALGQNQCGPQYAQFANGGGGGGGNFLTNLFGNNNPNPSGNVMTPPGGPDMGPPSGTYRTVCVRSCDGGYFPISFATSPARFADDDKTCKALCPATEANLYAYRNPGEDINQAVSVNGQPYTALPNAFHYRSEFNPTCSCRAQGQSWADALKSVDDKAEAQQQGDIIVTEESAKKMQQRQLAKQPVGKKGAASAPAPAETDTTAQAPAPTTTPSDNKQIRTVGPTFIPAH